MPTNNVSPTWPMTAEAWQKIERRARAERSRAVAAFGRGVARALKRVFTAKRPTAAWLPAGKGRLTA